MASIPSEKLIKKLQKQTKKIEAKKTKQQKKEGKFFINKGQGVIPENVWKRFKS